MKRITLEELLYSHSNFSYDQQYHYIMNLIKTGKIKQVGTSGTNGKKPALYRQYWILEEKKDYSELEEELKYRLHPKIQIDYYLSHPDIYEKDRRWVQMLDEYLRNGRSKLDYQESVNERSFEIWNREKFLSKEHGNSILKRCGLSRAELNIYETAEPLAYYSHTREVPQNLLILENKDTFYSMRKHLLDGNKTILGESVGTLIYGAGKRILRSFEDFSLCIEPYMKDGENTIYYFGDLDYEGIRIYEILAEMFQEHWKIIPFLPAYEAMFAKAEQVVQLPDTKEQQNRNIRDIFYGYFSDEQVNQIKNILESDRYIPQEILNITDF